MLCNSPRCCHRWVRRQRILLRVRGSLQLSMRLLINPIGSAHHIPQHMTNRLNWTGFDEQGFKNGVVRSFFNYIRWMGTSFHSFPWPTQLNRPIEGAEDGMSEDTEYSSGAEPTQTLQASSAVPSKSAAKATSTFQQPGRYRKRALSQTLSDVGATSEDEDDEEGLDTDDLADNGSSGSSVDSDHIPAKRLRTSIATHSSTTTPIPDEPTEETDVRQTPPTPSCHSESELMDMDSDEPNTGTGVSNAVRRAHEPVGKPPVTPSQSSPPSPEPESDPELKIPEFLVEKYKMYDYLSSIEETRFQKLLKAYVTFECANRTRIIGSLSTSRRPKAIGWWNSRARPHKVPPYDSLQTFTGSITKWWISLQPEWRKIDVGVVSRVGGGFKDWECLYQPGTNGLLNVIILAHWWARILVERDNTVDGVYSWFVSDVSWVLSQLTIVAPDAHD